MNRNVYIWRITLLIATGLGACTPDANDTQMISAQTPAPANVRTNASSQVPLERGIIPPAVDQIIVRPSKQQLQHHGKRPIDPSDIVTRPGYWVEVFAINLSYPVDITFSDAGEVFVAEAGGHTYGTGPEEAPPARIVKLTPDGPQVIYDKVLSLDVIRQHESSADMPEGIIPPLTGLTWHEGKLYVAHRSRYSVLDPNTGEFRTIVNGLPSWGEFLNAKPIFDSDGKMVFFLSTQGNTGVIEEHWIKVIRAFNKPNAHEVPGEDVELAGIDFDAPTDPKAPKNTARTGVYVPLGTTTQPGQVIKGQKICNGAFFRCNPDGTELERIAWGFRSSFGYRYSPSGRLVTTMNSANVMKPRGIHFDYEPVYEVIDGEWYGWPDYYSGLPVTDARFVVIGGPKKFVLTEATHRRLLRGRERPIQPLVRLTVHSAAQGMVFGREEFDLDPENEVLVAEMGSIIPLYKGDAWPPPQELVKTDFEIPQEKPDRVEMNWPGFQVERVNLQTGVTEAFLVNRSSKPASATNGGGLERPLQLEWGPDDALYVVDFGVIELTPDGMTAHPSTGVIWRVTHDPGRILGTPREHE